MKTTREKQITMLLTNYNSLIIFENNSAIEIQFKLDFTRGVSNSRPNV